MELLHNYLGCNFVHNHLLDTWANLIEFSILGILNFPPLYSGNCWRLLDKLNKINKTGF